MTPKETEAEVRSMLKQFTQHARRVLAVRDVEIFSVGRRGVDLAWREENDVRTFHAGAYATDPLIIRLSVDHYTLFSSRKIAKGLRLVPVARHGYQMIMPTTQAGSEISVLPDEVEAALEWIFARGVRVGAVSDPIQPPPPFVVGDDVRHNWRYMWSERAMERYDTQRKIVRDAIVPV